MDEELESPGKVKVLNLNLDPFRTTQGVKGKNESFMKGEDVNAFMVGIDHTELVGWQASHDTPAMHLFTVE